MFFLPVDDTGAEGQIQPHQYPQKQLGSPRPPDLSFLETLSEGLQRCSPIAVGARKDY